MLQMTKMSVNRSQRFSPYQWSYPWKVKILEAVFDLCIVLDTTANLANVFLL